MRLINDNNFSNLLFNSSREHKIKHYRKESLRIERIWMVNHTRENTSLKKRKNISARDVLEVGQI